jgi:hypothetical protein
MLNTFKDRLNRPGILYSYGIDPGREFAEFLQAAEKGENKDN